MSMNCGILEDRVTVIVPCYNCEPLIDETLRSVFGQSFQNFEIVLVDDCSTDGTFEKLSKWSARHDNIKLMSTETNSGPGVARNIAIEAAGSNLIALLDADDIWYPRKLEVQVALFSGTNCAISCTAYKYGGAYISSNKTDYKSLLRNNAINTSTVMFDRRHAKVRFISEYKSEDYVAWLQLVKLLPIHYINEVLVERRVINGLSANKLEMAVRRWQIYRKVEKLGLFESIYYFAYYGITGLNKHRKI